VFQQAVRNDKRFDHSASRMGNRFLAGGNKTFIQKIVLFISYSVSGLNNFLYLSIPVATLLLIYAMYEHFKVRCAISAIIVLYVFGFFMHIFFVIRYLNK
jgi:hypothetical protein